MYERQGKRSVGRNGGSDGTGAGLSLIATCGLSMILTRSLSLPLALAARYNCLYTAVLLLSKTT